MLTLECEHPDLRTGEELLESFPLFHPISPDMFTRTDQEGVYLFPESEFARLPVFDWAQLLNLNSVIDGLISSVERDPQVGTKNLRKKIALLAEERARTRVAADRQRRAYQNAPPPPPPVPDGGFPSSAVPPPPPVPEGGFPDAGAGSSGEYTYFVPTFTEPQWHGAEAVDGGTGAGR